MKKNTERAYQNQAFWARKKLRRYLLAWLRQGGKTRTLARMALREMMLKAGHLVTFASASLGIGSELIEKEAKTWHDLFADFKTYLEEQGKYRLVGVETKDKRGDAVRELPSDLAWEDLADIMERNKFELRIWHSNTVCSRTKVIAANIATARSWSGSVYLDEAAFVRELAVLLAELEPMAATDRDFSFIMATTPPADFGHYAYELMSPIDGQEEWEIKAEGNWYRNKENLWVHRVTIDDAALAGRKVFDPDTGAEQTIEENRLSSLNREGWDRSNRLLRPQVGTNMISPMAVDAAMQRGKAFQAHEGELPAGALEKLLEQLGNEPITIGMDVATTEGKKSNPTAVAVCQRKGVFYNVPLVWWWKTSQPEVTTNRVKWLASALKDAGKKVKVVDVDATNERFFTTNLRTIFKKLRLAFVRLIIKSKKAAYKGEEMSLGSYMSNLTANAFEDNYIAVPMHRYLASDFARKKRDGSGFTAAVGPNGEHADTLDAVELSIHGQAMRGGASQAAAAPVGELAGKSGGQTFRSSLQNPLIKKLKQIFRINS